MSQVARTPLERIRNHNSERRRGAVAARVMIDGAALRDVLNLYRRSDICAEVARRKLLRLGVAGNAAEALIKAFRPREAS